MIKRTTLALGLLCIGAVAILACSSSETKTEAVAVTPSSGPFTYEHYSALLTKHIDKDGMVDYKGLKTDRATLDTFVHSMSALSKEDYKSWSEQEQLAFWINAYNAVTLQSILNNYPIQAGSLINRARFPTNSIRQISGVWDQHETSILGTPITLNDIEHKVLRKDFSEPRIHVSIVCASIGCPPLRNEAFVAEKLDEQLNDQSKRFMGHSRNLSIDTDNKTINLSAILDWFGEDFEGHYTIPGREGTDAAVLGYVHKFVSEADQKSLADSTYSIKYQDYDWTLNEQP